MIKNEAANEEKDSQSSEDDDRVNPLDQGPNDRVQCPNCSQEMLFRELAAHTVQCYRNSTKCKVCGDIINKDKKKEHLMRWRDQTQLKNAIIEDKEEQVSQHFDHGMDCNMQFTSSTPTIKIDSKSLSKIPIPDAKN